MMIDATRIYLPWLLSVITIYTMWQAGNRHRFTWLVGLSNQALWLVWIIVSSAWGLLPMNFALWFVYGRNHMKWAKERRQELRDIANEEIYGGPASEYDAAAHSSKYPY